MPKNFEILAEDKVIRLRAGKPGLENAA